MEVFSRTDVVIAVSPGCNVAPFFFSSGVTNAVGEDDFLFRSPTGIVLVGGGGSVFSLTEGLDALPSS